MTDGKCMALIKVTVLVDVCFFCLAITMQQSALHIICLDHSNIINDITNSELAAVIISKLAASSDRWTAH